MTDTHHIIILTAILNDWESVIHLLPKIDHCLHKINARGTVVVVDDGSCELKGREEIGYLTLEAIQSVVTLVLHRNVGSQRALAIGMGYIAEQMKGDYVVVLDADHEDNPEYIPALLETCIKSGGNKIVFAERTKRSERWWFVALYKLYQQIHRAFVGEAIAVGNYSLIPWEIVGRLAHVGELWHHFAAAIIKSRLPFLTVPTERRVRLFGTSKMNLVTLVTHAMGSFAVHAETVAVRVTLTAGLAGLLVAAAAVALVVLRSATDFAIIGWTSQILGLLGIFLLQLFIAAGVMMFIVIALRTSPPNFPVLEYGKFIFKVETLKSGSAT